MSVDKSKAPTGDRSQSPEEKHEELATQFCKCTISLTTKHKCDDCGQLVNFIKFRNGGGNIERLCMHNINLDTVMECKSSGNKPTTFPYAMQYTDYHRLLEYTTNTEKNLIPWFPEWWTKSNFNADSSIVKLNNGIEQINQFVPKCESIAFCKKQYLQNIHKLTNVNEWVLQADIRFLHFCRQCLIYWLKLNKSEFYKARIVHQDLECHACGVAAYSDTQYSRHLTSPYSRDKMAHIEWVDGNQMKWFVCEWCIGLCYMRSFNEYKTLKKKSDMYPTSWCKLEHWQQTMFGIAHLDTKKFPLYLAWYNIAQESWYHGQITGIADMTKGIIEVMPEETVGSHQVSMKISIKIQNKNQYFLYSRPSSSISPLFALPPNVKLYDREILSNGEYIIDTTCERWKRTFKAENILLKDVDHFSNAIPIQIIRNGTLEETRLQSIKKNKHTFDILSKLKFFE